MKLAEKECVGVWFLLRKKPKPCYVGFVFTYKGPLLNHLWKQQTTFVTIALLYFVQTKMLHKTFAKTVSLHNGKKTLAFVPQMWNFDQTAEIHPNNVLAFDV